MKVAKDTAEKMRKLLRGFAAMDNPVIYNTGLDEMERILADLKPTAPGGLRATLIEIENRIGDIRLCLKKNESEMPVKELAVKFAIGVGVQFALLCAELARTRGYGRKENPVWDYVRKILADQPGMKKESICRDAITALKKDHPRARKPKLSSLAKHYAEHV